MRIIPYRQDFSALLLAFLALLAFPAVMRAQSSLLPQSGSSAPEKWRQVYHYRYDWQIADPASRMLVPYLPDLHKAVNAAFLPIDPLKCPGCTLELSVPEQSGIADVFINQQLVARLVPGQYLALLLKSLPASEQGEWLLAVYYSRPLSQMPSAQLLIAETPDEKAVNAYRAFLADFEQEKEQEAVLPAGMPRPSATFFHLTTSFAFLLLFLMGIYVRLSGLDVSIDSLIRATGWASTLVGRKDQAQRVSAVAFGGMLVYYPLSLTLAFTLLDDGHDFIGPGISAAQIDTTLFLTGTATLWLEVLIFLALQILLIRVVTLMMSYRQLLALHLNEMIGMNRFFALFIAIGAIWMAAQGGYDNHHLATLGFLTLLLSKSILTVLRIYRQYTFNKVYLFSYFCAVELLPLTLATKYFIRF